MKSSVDQLCSIPSNIKTELLLFISLIHSWRTVVGHVVGIFFLLIDIPHFVPDRLRVVDKKLGLHNKRQLKCDFAGLLLLLVVIHNKKGMRCVTYTFMCSYRFFNFGYFHPVVLLDYTGAGDMAGIDSRVC